MRLVPKGLGFTLPVSSEFVGVTFPTTIQRKACFHSHLADSSAWVGPGTGSGNSVLSFFPPPRWWKLLTSHCLEEVRERWALLGKVRPHTPTWGKFGGRSIVLMGCALT